MGLLSPYLTLRLSTMTFESCRPPPRSQGLPGARCIRKKVIVITNRRTGIIQRMRRPMYRARLAPRVRGSRRETRAPRAGAPFAIANCLLVAGDVDRVCVEVAWQVGRLVD